MCHHPSFCTLLLKNYTKTLTDVISRSTRCLPQCPNGVINRRKHKCLCWNLHIKYCSSEIKHLWIPRERYRLLSFTTKLGVFGILFKGSRNLWSNRDQPLQNFISNLTARLDIQSLDVDNEKKNISLFVIMSMFRVHCVNSWELKKH